MTCHKPDEVKAEGSHLVFERDVCGVSGEPVVLFFEELDGGVEVVEVLVAEELVVDDVPLSASVLEGIAVALAREVEPLKDTHKSVSRM